MTSPGTLADADAVAALLSWQRGHPAVIAALGDAAHISGRNEAPYPRCRIAPSAGGNDRDLRWASDQEVVLETYGALDGTPGQAALRHLHYTMLEAARGIADADPTAGTTVVTAIRSSSPARFAPEPVTGQPAWRSTLVLTCHPPAEIST